MKGCRISLADFSKCNHVLAPFGSCSRLVASALLGRLSEAYGLSRSDGRGVEDISFCLHEYTSPFASKNTHREPTERCISVRGTYSSSVRGSYSRTQLRRGSELSAGHAAVDRSVSEATHPHVAHLLEQYAQVKNRSEKEIDAAGHDPSKSAIGIGSRHCIGIGRL